MARYKKSTKTIQYLFFTILLISFFYFIYIAYNTSSNVEKSNDELQGIKVSYFNVGQADSILIQVDNDNILIDAGNNNDGEKLVNYLKKQNITSFKYVFGTHAHEDHIGGLDNVINNFDIERFFMPNVITTTKTFEDVLDALLSKKLKFETPNIGDKYSVGNLLIEVLYVGTSDNNLNNTSIVLKITYKNIKFLFMGDAEKEVEKDLLDKDIKSDILKVGHHGSNSSSSEEFIKKVNPSYAVISVGKNNSYNHPKKVTLDILNKYNVKVLRTDELGTIIITSDGEKIHYNNVDTNIDGM